MAETRSNGHRPSRERAPTKLLGSQSLPPSEPPVTPERSAQMSLVRAANSRAELTVRSALHRAGYRYRLHVRDLPGSPDIVFPSRRVAIFIHGCFWHRHPGCAATRTPKTRVAFWEQKFTRNMERDRRAAAELEKIGWTVHVIWECETKRLDEALPRLRALLDSPCCTPLR